MRRGVWVSGMTASALLRLAGCGAVEDVTLGSNDSTAGAPEESTSVSSSEPSLPPRSSTITTPPPDTSGFHIASVQPVDATIGQPFTVVGRGCVDPATSSADGLTVEVHFGPYEGMPFAAPEPDGSFSITAPLPDGFGSGEQSAIAACVRGSDTSDRIDVVPESEPVKFVVTSSFTYTLTPTTIRAGETVTVTVVD